MEPDSRPGNPEAGSLARIARRFPLVMFFSTAFAITWGIAAVFLVGYEELEALFGEAQSMDQMLDNPFFHASFWLATAAAPISAFLVIGLAHGRGGLKAYLRRVFTFRGVGLRWYALVVLGNVAFYVVVVQFLHRALGGSAPVNLDFDLSSSWVLILGSFLLLVLKDPSPLEELGWRGFALPLLQQRHSGLSAAVILGLLWSVWHLPAFFLAGLQQAQWSFGWFALSMTLWTIVWASIYNATNGSIPLMYLCHGVAGWCTLFLFEPDGLLMQIEVAILVPVVALLIWKLGPNLGRRMYTDVVPGFSWTDYQRTRSLERQEGEAAGWR